MYIRQLNTFELVRHPHHVRSAQFPYLDDARMDLLSNYRYVITYILHILTISISNTRFPINYLHVLFDCVLYLQVYDRLF